MHRCWNHNTAYHPWILRAIVEHPRARMLDVGCGDGLLLERLAPYAGTLVGLEPDPATADRAAQRLAHLPHATVLTETFDEHTAEHPYDTIIFVASLHHMDLTSALARARDLLTPGGELVVVGLAANRSPGDWMVAALQVVPAFIGSRLHRETRETAAPTVAPRESLAEIRATARALLPGARIRRGLYYRYLLRWRKP
ncbi:bifunctional 2-polyprenyl-6-hydroxyphenol methylase/3-demethylubiquinol 3-O-methyltransferase UbiG, partial [Corynebacterium sp.]|uniref:class I SAM-dependent methyltransferase n=1 Tax=Corynebacterium sp. TaxID=1720 RepID=UPI0026DF29F8